MIAAAYAAEVADSARSVLERETPRDQILTRLRSEPLSRSAWKAAAEVGWFRMLATEAAGGLDAGPAEVAALFREIGTYLPAGPYAESVVAAGQLRSIADLGPEEAVITFGEIVGASVARGRLSGRAVHVEYADVSDRLLLRIDLDGVSVIGGVDPSEAGAAATGSGSFDLVERPCLVELEGAPFEVLIAGADADRLLDRIDRLCHVAQVATLAGIGREVLDMSVQYAKDRVQFDRPIGSFQAVQHRLAEMAVTRGAIESAVDASIGLAEAGGLDELAAMHGLAADFARDVVQSALQVHGGIGFTDEHRLHVYLKHVLRLQALAAGTDPLARLGSRLLTGSAS